MCTCRKGKWFDGLLGLVQARLCRRRPKLRGNQKLGVRVVMKMEMKQAMQGVKKRTRGQDVSEEV